MTRARSERAAPTASQSLSKTPLSWNFAEDEADVAIRAKRRAETALVGRKIADSPWAVYASRSYVAQHGGIDNPGQIDRHSVVVFSGALSDHHTARWIKSVAPNAHVAARANSVAALLPSVKSGAGLAAMPVIVGEGERDLVRVLDLGQEMATPFYLLTHRDLRRNPPRACILRFHY